MSRIMPRTGWTNVIRVAGLMAAMCWSGHALAQEVQPEPDPLASIVAWQKGPGAGKLGDQAEVRIPAGYRFADGDAARTLLEMMGNITNGDEMGLIMPDDPEAGWFVVFEFDKIGYVKDEEKDKLDAGAILASIKAGTEAANQERKKRGHSPLEITGWEKAPAFNDQTKNLEWAIRASSEGEPIINYDVRLLGRHGVMSASLVAGPEELSAVMPAFRKLLEGFSYTSGNRYAEFRSGDKIAEYGLTALITGGAAAVALKTGLFKKFWKLIVVGVVGVGAGIKKLFGRKATA